MHLRLEESLFVKFRFRFDELLIDELQNTIRAKSERIMNWLLDGVVGITNGAIDVRDGMTRCASDACLRRGMIFQIEVGIVERATKERRYIMTTGAPA